MIRDTQKQKILLEQTRRVFYTSDLAVLWNITNKNTLLTTIKRYVQRNILYRIRKGLYSTISIKKLHVYELGCALSGHLSYVTTETVLENSGIIMQRLNKVTLLGKKRQEFKVNGTTYLCRYLNHKFLVNREGIVEKDRYVIATVERAIADIYHINPKYYLDNEIAINHTKINRLKSMIGYK